MISAVTFFSPERALALVTTPQILKLLEDAGSREMNE